MMFFFAYLLLLVQLVIAAPLQTRQLAPAAHPAIEVLQDVAAKLQLVIREVDRFNGEQKSADTLVRDSMEALDTLHVAIKEVDSSPDIGYLQALTFLPVATTLVTNAFTLVRSVKAKATVLSKSEPIRTYEVLDQCYHGVNMLGQSFDKKLPGGVAALMRGVTGSVVSTLKDTRDSFKVAGVEPMSDPGAAPVVAPPQAATPQYRPQPNYQPQPNFQAQPNYQSQPNAPQQQGRPQYLPQPQYQPQPAAGQQFQPYPHPPVTPSAPIQGLGQGQGTGLGQDELNNAQPQYAPYPGVPAYSSDDQTSGQESQYPAWAQKQSSW